MPCLGIAHHDTARNVRVLDLLMAQTGAPPFNPRHAVAKFAALLKEYGLSIVTGDAYAGETFRRDFEAEGISYSVSTQSKSEIYEAFEPKLNAGEIELLDDGKLQEQLLTLVIRGSKIDHQSGDHDDIANAAAGAVVLVGTRAPMRINPEAIRRMSQPLFNARPPLEDNMAWRG